VDGAAAEQPVPDPYKPKPKKKGEGCGSGHDNYKVKQVVKKLLSDQILGLVLAEYGSDDAQDDAAEMQIDTAALTQAVKDTIASVQGGVEEGAKLIDGFVQKFVNGCARTIVAHPEFLRRLKIAAERHKVALQRKEKREASARSGNLNPNAQPKLSSSHTVPTGVNGKYVIRSSHRGLPSKKKAVPAKGGQTVH
jgi:hypothetical protein